jgi:hypothetical protein
MVGESPFIIPLVLSHTHRLVPPVRFFLKAADRPIQMLFAQGESSLTTSGCRTIER